MLNNWLKIAFANYKKNWFSTIINLLGLTLGLTGFVLILMLWNDEASYEKWNPKKDNIYFVQPYYGTNKEFGNNLSFPFVKKSMELLPEVKDYVLFNGYGYSAKFSASGKSVFQENGANVSENFFNFFPFKILSGSKMDALKGEDKVIISSSLSQKLFGSNNGAGQKVEISGKSHMITAVYELPKGNSAVKPDYAVIAGNIAYDEKTEAWGNYNYQVLFKLDPNTDLEKLDKDFYNKVVLLGAKIQSKGNSRDFKDYLEKYFPKGAEFTKLDQVNLHAKASFITKADYKNILTLFALSVLIIILSAINFINLKTAQSSQRAKEVGVRKAIGSNRKQLVLQFLLETFIICITAYVLSLVLVELLLPSFNKFYNKEIAMTDGKVYGYSLLFVVIVAFISGLIPAFYLSNFKPINTLKGNFARSKNGILLRNSILTLQLVISSFFIICGLITHLQVDYMLRKDLGFKGDQIININFKDTNESKGWLKYERLKNEIIKMPGVADVSYGEASPGTGAQSSSNVDYLDKTLQGIHGSMDYNYLQFLGVKLKAGRWLDPKLASDTINNFIVNEAFVKKFGWTNEEALNKEVSPGFDRKKYKIVGVIKDFNVYGVRTDVDPTVFFHYLETEWKRNQVWNMQVKLYGEDIPGTIERLKTFWEKSAEPGYPFDYYFIDKQFARSFDKYKKQRTLFTILNIIVLTVALLGLFALSSLLIEQKLKDVAIKKTLGASEKSIVLDLTKKFLVISAIAVLISIPISYYFMNEWLKDFAYRIEMPWFPYVLSFVILLLLTFAVVSIKAYRATQVNLVKYLKYE
ncbi:ABC transporter permease [Chryseobacterium taklimakanense]|uniref:FtsX-like permease family protein n=1 Tax=Chryseobacterium taklimakanense TaxID=536441 RepID=A0A3G8WH82_9FLAO|nr:FtsX-like permease family protein [Chryseobacterium taklimakanense]AZI19899.1 FtsX-like permease family protein [Chryseobacterium taklimakanense]